ncbi:MAG: GNAT family N-acetyltransferase [Synechococcaceae cyanobacterium]
MAYTAGTAAEPAGLVPAATGGAPLSHQTVVANSKAGNAIRPDIDTSVGASHLELSGAEHNASVPGCAFGVRRRGGGGSGGGGGGGLGGGGGDSAGGGSCGGGHGGDCAGGDSVKDGGADATPVPLRLQGRIRKRRSARETGGSSGRRCDNRGPVASHPLVAPNLPVRIRAYEPADWPAVWALLEPVFRAGETFPHDPAITATEARVAWVDHTQVVMVATDVAGALLGTYYLKPNALALGAHVANAGYVVAPHCRRQGLGSQLCQHSLHTARQLGYRLMQFNLVVSTNTAGLRCWRRNGFQIVGSVPGAFRHPRLGYVDAVVMVQSLVEEPGA